MIVRAGSPIASNVSRLRGMTVPSVEGPIRLGYLQGGMGLYLRAGMGALPARRPRVSFGVLPGRRGRGLSGVSISNLSGGSNTSFKVGDRWQLSITGAPANAGVYLNASVCSPDFSRCAEPPMSGQQDIAASLWTGTYQNGQAIGQTDANGNFTASGTFDSTQIGTWTQHWNVGGQQAGDLQFSVTDPSGNASYAGPVVPAGTPYYTLASDHSAAPGTGPAPVVQTLDQQLAAQGVTLAPTGQLVPVTQVAAASSAPAAGSSGGAAAAVSGFNLSSIPTWGWIAAAGVGALILFGGHKH